MVKTAVTLSGVLLDNPVIPASGTFGFGYEFAQWYDINCLGAISIKGTTREPRFGNPAPRIAETAGGMLNAVGLQNPGIDRVVSEELPKLREVYQKPILANISGFSLDEYVTCCAKADASPYTDLIEVNVSCRRIESHQYPHGHADRPEKTGACFGQHHRRSFRTSGFSRGVADGLAGLRGGPSAHHWDGRHPKRRRCPGNDAGRSDRCAGGGG